MATRCWRRLPHRQAGQSSAEYIVVTSAIVFALMQPITPPGSLQCPASAIRTDWSEKENKCNVLEILGQTLRNRYEGYSYAISASEYPELLVNYTGGSGSGGGTSGGTGGSGGSGGGGGYKPPSATDAVGLDGKTVIGTVMGNKVYDDAGKLIGTVDSKGNVIDDKGNKIGTYPASAGYGGTNYAAVDFAGKVLGKVDEDGFVIDEDGDIVGKKDPSSSDVWEVDGLGKVKLDANNDPIVIGLVGVIESNGDVVDKNGKVIGNINN